MGLERIWVKRSHRGLMDEVRAVECVAGAGIVGNTEQGRRRPVTVLSAERWEQVEAELGHPVDPVVRRANLLVSGVELAESRGRTLAVGPVRLRVTTETRPCRLMDLAVPGLQAALDAGWGGGASAQVTVGGVIAVGDDVAWVEDGPPR